MSRYAVKNIGNEARIEWHDLLGLSGCEIGVNRMPKGVGVPFQHKHQQNEEVYIVLEGQGCDDS